MRFLGLGKPRKVIYAGFEGLSLYLPEHLLDAVQDDFDTRVGMRDCWEDLQKPEYKLDKRRVQHWGEPEYKLDERGQKRGASSGSQKRRRVIGEELA